MGLRDLLQSIGAVHGLPQLVAGLGHRSEWEPVPGQAWNSSGGRAFSYTLVGLTGKVPWFAIESLEPGKDSVRVARRISRRGKVAVVLALNRQARRLGVAVAFGRCPALELDLANPDAEHVAALGRLAGGADSGSLAYAARAADALSTEPVGRRFFREFKATLDRMARALPGPMSAADRHALVLIQLTRVLFLYFIQSKGWLDRRERFLAEQVDRCLSQRRRIHRDLLRPLFFGTLNQPPSGRTKIARGFGAVPFLNGGLFEPHRLERTHRCDLPNPLWRDAFDTLFERFHFTVAENGILGSVAPDMLGRVFEGVMTPDDRKTSGTFYTPAVLVDQLLDAALALHLSIRADCSEAEARQRLEDRDPGSAEFFHDITVLDHAVGSGAFLLGALNRLSALGRDADIAVRKRRVLERSLFGVDKNAAAVRLAELRLWLSVVADDPTESAQGVRPLPNLDCLIRQGDSLIEPAGLETLAGGSLNDGTLAADLSRLRGQVIGASGPEKNILTRRLRQLEARALEQTLESAERHNREMISQCLEQARTPDLFGQRRGLDRELCGFVKEVRLSLRGLRQVQRRLSREGEVPWFHYQSAFADVFARGGFDLIVGNPPWLRSEAIPRETRKQLRGRYRWWRHTGAFGASPDLSVAFLERAFELTAAGGIVAMLVPAKLATASYGAAVRHGLATNTTLHILADLSNRPEAAFDATVYPLALVARKSPPLGNHRVRTSLHEKHESRRIGQSQLGSGGPWVLTRGRAPELVAELRQNHPSLSDGLTCHLGVKTGLNQAFLDPPMSIEPQVLRWAVRGRDVRAFRCCPKLRLLWTHDDRGEPLAELPPNALTHLAPYEPQLRARRDFCGGPPWSVFRARPALAKYRVLWRDLARRLTAAALIGQQGLELIPLNTCYLVTLRNAIGAQAIAGWLNSIWIGVIATLGAVPASGGFFRFNARAVERLPLPSAALSDPALAQLSRAGQMREPVQAELDRLVGCHLGLSRREEKVLRGSVDGRSFDHR